MKDKIVKFIKDFLKEIVLPILAGCSILVVLSVFIPESKEYTPADEVEIKKDSYSQRLFWPKRKEEYFSEVRYFFIVYTEDDPKRIIIRSSEGHFFSAEYQGEILERGDYVKLKKVSFWSGDLWMTEYLVAQKIK